MTGAGEFFSNEQLSPIERAGQLADRYPEMGWMVNASTHATPERSFTASGTTVGAALFPAADRASLVEFDRAYVAIASMDWVRADDYASLTACQPETDVLSPELFEWLREHTDRILSDESAVRAMEAFLAINDLGKISAFADAVRQMPGAPDTVDHDVIMYYGLQQQPSLSPTFAGLPPKYQQMILDGMGTGFNLGQLLQGEGVPANLAGLAAVGQETRDFYLLHTLYDLGGVAGQSVQNGSLLLTESMVRNYRDAYESIGGMASGQSIEAVYHGYLGKMARRVEIMVPPGQGVPVSVRLAGMLSLKGEVQRNRLLAAYSRLAKESPEDFMTFEEEVFQAGDTNRRIGLSLYRQDSRNRVSTLIYYAPALLRNLQKQAAGNPEQWETNIVLGLRTLARIYRAGRDRDVVRQAKRGGVQTILISEIARAAAKNPELLRTGKIVLVGNGLDVEARLEPAV